MTKKQRNEHRSRDYRWLNRGTWASVPIYGPARRRWWWWLMWWRTPTQVIVGSRRSGFDHTRRTAHPVKKARRLMVQQSRRLNR